MRKWALRGVVLLVLAVGLFVVHGLSEARAPANALATAAGRFRWIEVPTYLFAGSFVAGLCGLVCLLTALVLSLRRAAG